MSTQLSQIAKKEWRSSQKSSGKPIAGNLHAGSAWGDEPSSLGEGTGAKASDNSEAPQRATASRLVSTILRI